MNLSELKAERLNLLAALAVRIQKDIADTWVKVHQLDGAIWAIEQSNESTLPGIEIFPVTSVDSSQT